MQWACMEEGAVGSDLLVSCRSPAAHGGLLAPGLGTGSGTRAESPVLGAGALGVTDVPVCLLGLRLWLAPPPRRPGSLAYVLWNSARLVLPACLAILDVGGQDETKGFTWLHRDLTKAALPELLTLSRAEPAGHNGDTRRGMDASH